MKGRFPSDLITALLAPLIVIVVALGLGSIIFHVAQTGGPVAVRALVATFIIACLGLIFFRRRSRP